MNPEYRVLEKASFNNQPSVSIDGGFKSVVSSLTVVLVVVILLTVFMRFTVALAYAVNTASPTAKLKAKEDFRKGVIGLILGLLFVSLINYINPNFVTLSWENLGTRSASSTPGTGTVGPGSTTTPPTPPPLVTGGRDINAILATEQAIRNRLAAAAISVNNAACTTVGQKGCTNVGGMSEETIGMLLRYRGQCLNCAFVITGGTEWWLHSANTKHDPRGGAVDLRNDTNLNRFIQTTFPPNLGSTASCYQRYSISLSGRSWSFCDEIPKCNAQNQCSTRHWHIQ